jgi:hypothetical protein
MPSGIHNKAIGTTLYAKWHREHPIGAIVYANLHTQQAQWVVHLLCMLIGIQRNLNGSVVYATWHTQQPIGSDVYGIDVGMCDIYIYIYIFPLRSNKIK